MILKILGNNDSVLNKISGKVERENHSTIIKNLILPLFLDTAVGTKIKFMRFYRYEIICIVGNSGQIVENIDLVRKKAEEVFFFISSNKDTKDEMIQRRSYCFLFSFASARILNYNFYNFLEAF